MGIIRKTEHYQEVDMLTKWMMIAALYVMFVILDVAFCWGQEKIVPNIVCYDYSTPTCHPGYDKLCWNWCEYETLSVGDVRHWNGQLWKEHWKACDAYLMEWAGLAADRLIEIERLKRKLRSKR